MDTRDVTPPEDWHERARRLNKQLPDLNTFDWGIELQGNEEFFISILSDMIKMGGESMSSGPRRSLSREAAQEQLDQLMSNDFSAANFQESFLSLVEKDSVRTIATKTGLNRNTIHRLQTGAIEADPWHMDCIARAYGKHPSFFKEWRNMYLSVAVMSRLEANPEASIQAYLKFDQMAKTRNL